MEVFDFRFRVKAPVEAVSAFHFAPGALKTLTPPLTYMQVHRYEPMAEGSVAEFTLWMGPIPVRWKAIHSEISEAGFTDTQVEGPMKHWVHTHRFSAIDDEHTEVHEHIEYQHHSGLKGLFSRVLFAPIGLRALFAVRRAITRRELQKRS